VSVLIIGFFLSPRRWIRLLRPVRHLPRTQQSFHTYFRADNAGVLGNLGNLFQIAALALLESKGV
jgi:hypothetical protein